MQLFMMLSAEVLRAWVIVRVTHVVVRACHLRSESLSITHVVSHWGALRSDSLGITSVVSPGGRDATVALMHGSVGEGAVRS